MEKESCMHVEFNSDTEKSYSLKSYLLLLLQKLCPHFVFLLLLLHFYCFLRSKLCTFFHFDLHTHFSFAQKHSTAKKRVRDSSSSSSSFFQFLGTPFYFSAVDRGREEEGENLLSCPNNSCPRRKGGRKERNFPNGGFLPSSSSNTTATTGEEQWYNATRSFPSLPTHTTLLARTLPPSFHLFTGDDDHQLLPESMVSNNVIVSNGMCADSHINFKYIFNKLNY